MYGVSGSLTIACKRRKTRPRKICNSNVFSGCVSVWYRFTHTIL